MRVVIIISKPKTTKLSRSPHFTHSTPVKQTLSFVLLLRTSNGCRLPCLPWLLTRRPDAMPSLAHPALGTSRTVRRVQRRRRFSCSILLVFTWIYAR